MPIKKKKISELTLTDSLKGLFTIGYKVVDGVKISVKVGLEYIQVAYEDVVKATNDAISAAKTALDAASAADTSRKAIEANEAEREGNEDARITSEQERSAAEIKRAAAETGRVTAENTRVSEFSKLKTESEKATGDAIIATGKTNEAIHNAEVATDAANVATASANQAAIEANQSADNADKKALLAEQAAASANDTANHPTYIGTDHYVYKWNKTTKAYDKTDIYTKGDAFSIKKVYASVAALQSDVNNTDIAEGDFVLVNTNDVENPDNAKLYVKVKNSDGTFSYSFLVDMSGAIGFTGKTPQFSMGNISTLEAGSTATATVSEDGTDSDGNPKYRINFAIPRGNPGAPFRVAGQYTTIEALNAAVPDGSAVDGFMAVGTKSPYDYYAWVNGGWVSQGQIAGGSGNIVEIPFHVLNLTSTSTHLEIINAWGGLNNFISVSKSLNQCPVSASIGGVFDKDASNLIPTAVSSNYTDDDNIQISFNVLMGNAYINFEFNLIAGLATCAVTGKYLLTQSNIANDFNGEVDKVLSAAMGKKLNDEKASKEDVLTKTNTTEFFPTADYHPATKKYVDDNLPKYLKKSNGDEGWIRIAAFTYKTTFVATLTIMPDDSYVSPAVIIISGESMESKFIIHTLFKATDSYDNIKKIRTIVNATTNVGYVDIMYDHYSDFFYNITNNVNIEAVATVDDNTIPSGFSVGKEYDLNTSTVVSDNITTITKKTAAEYAAISPKDANTGYFVTD